MFSLKYIFCFLFCINHVSFIMGFNMPNNRITFTANRLLTTTKNDRQILLLDSSNKDGSPNEPIDIFFTGAMTDETCNELSLTLHRYKNQIMSNDEIHIQKINLYIQSQGGSLFPTLALVDEIKNFEIPLETYIRGYAASAATLISVVGSKRYMYEHSIIMIHGIKLVADEVNTLTEVRDLHENVDLFMKTIKHIYLENSNISEEKLEYFFTKDKWISANEALSYGLIDKII